MTTPEKDLWVNLSPYEKDRIIPSQLGQTELGRDMLAQDYMLKQLTASLVYPEKGLGKEFWNRIYAQAQAKFGNAQIPVNTFNKVWITADQAKVFVHANTAFVVGAHLKVMTEEDYLSMTKHQDQSLTAKTPNLAAQQIIREILLPAIEKEVNEGKNFANLRQIFHSMILATWYKKNLKEALLNQVYANKSKVNGVDVQDKSVKEKIYQQYLQAYKKGVFNYIKEDVNQVSKQATAKKYFSGGLMNMAQATVVGADDLAMQAIATGATSFGAGSLLNAAVTVERSNQASAAMIVIRNDAKIVSVKPANQQVTIKVKGTAGWRTYMQPQLTIADLQGIENSGAALQELTKKEYIDWEGVIDFAKLPKTFEEFTVSDVFLPQKQALYDALMNKSKQEGPINAETLARATSASVLQMLHLVDQGKYTTKKPGVLRVLVGYDGRPKADVYADVMARVAGAYQGVEVDITNDLIATPDAMAASHRSEQYDLVLMGSPSHNDFRYFGLKVGNNGGIADDGITGEIDKLANSKQGKESYPILPTGTRINKVDLKRKMDARIAQAFPTLPADIRKLGQQKPNSLYINFMHGSDGRYAEYFRQMGFEVHMEKPMRDGGYPTNKVNEDGKKVFWRPQPVRPMLPQLEEFENDKKVPEGALYLAIDSDADRFAVWQKVNGKAVEISPNDLSLMFLDYMINNNLVPDGVKSIVLTRPTSKAAAKRARREGYEVITTPVGSKYLKSYMNDSENPQATLVFEESGHGGFRMKLANGKPVTFFDAGLAQALLFMDIVTKGYDPVKYISDIRKKIGYDRIYKKIAVNATDDAKNKIRKFLGEKPETVRIMGRNINNVSELVQLIKSIVQPEGKRYTVMQVLHTSADEKLVTTEDFQSKHITLNPNEGLNIQFNTNDGNDYVWIEIRMSGTEPIIRIYGEFESQKEAERVMKVINDEFFADKAMSTYSPTSLVQYEDETGYVNAAMASSRITQRSAVVSKEITPKHPLNIRQLASSTLTIVGGNNAYAIRLIGGQWRVENLSNRTVSHYPLTPTPQLIGDNISVQIFKKVTKFTISQGSATYSFDNAAVVNTTEVRGGIDLNAGKMRMDESGEKMDIRINKAMVAQFERGDFSGVRPVILGITNLPSVFPLMGFKEPEMRARLASV